MKNFSKLLKVMVAVLAITLAFGLTGNTAQAAKKKSVTIFKGEKVAYTIFLGKLKSVKSSKKSVCSVSKEDGKAILTAKKTGKSTVTLKTNRGSLIYKVTVKGNPFKLSYTNKSKGIVVQGVNNSSKAFNWATVTATFCDAAGNPVTEETGTLWHVGPKQKAYADINVYKSGIDFSKTKLTVYPDGWSRGLEAKYKGYGKNVKSSIKVESGRYKLHASTKYKGRGGVYVAADIAFKDASGNIVDVNSEFLYLYKNKKVDTTTGITMPYGATSYEVLNKRAYLDY